MAEGYVEQRYAITGRPKMAAAATPLDHGMGLPMIRIERPAPHRQ
jgi:hypothetical protein